MTNRNEKGIDMDNDKQEVKQTPTEIAAQLWCLPRHSHKQMDVLLCEDIAKALSAEREKLATANAKIVELEVELANQTYKGNSIGYIYDKMTCYKFQVGTMYKVFEMLGIDYAGSGIDMHERETNSLKAVATANKKAEKLVEALEVIRNLDYDYDGLFFVADRAIKEFRGGE